MFPYQVLISQLDEGPKCGGVLVAERFIVTSATCVLDFGGIKKFLEEAVLYGGGTSLLFDFGDVVDAVIHPQYTVNPMAYDVALVKYNLQENGPRLKSAVFNGSASEETVCVISSWWETEDKWPEHLVWMSVSQIPCSPPEPNLICFTDENLFHKYDLGSPVVCGGVLTGLAPRGGGSKAINLTSDYWWIADTMAELAVTQVLHNSTEDQDPKVYFLQILEKLNLLSDAKSDSDRDRLTNWNNQIVIPMSYVLFAMVIFFFVLLFFIILFTVVLVYYSRK
ncbi:plasma kallikrein-like [Homalodisca vitripennis]|uniref:plasma kallikrein-like n=1 Tax=Homalodisca vitripennis TaxID=197043 RepID=UPI001EEACE74|nr:plasma kallikrein-like [Homalodisca vitripennis]